MVEQMGHELVASLDDEKADMKVGLKAFYWVGEKGVTMVDWMAA